MSWKPYENTLACWNPLATTWKMEYICNFDSVGVQSYQDQEMGMRATANTLALSYYTPIRTMLKIEGFDREAIRNSLSTWGTCSGTGCDSLLKKMKMVFYVLCVAPLKDQTPPISIVSLLGNDR